MAQQENELLKKRLISVRPKKREVFAFIEAHSKEFRVEKMCEVLGVSRSGFYKWRGKSGFM